MITLNINLPPKRIRKVSVNGTSHFLIQGDCLEVLKKIPDESIDLIIADPPYNVGLNYGKYYKDRMKPREYFNYWMERFSEFPRILKKTGSIYLISYPEINARFLPFFEDELKLKFRRWITWHYPTNIGHSKRNFTRSQRSILFFTKTNKYVFNRKYVIQPYKNPTSNKIKKRIKEGSKGRTSYDFLSIVDLLELNEDISDVIIMNLLKNVSKDRVGSRNNGDIFYHPCQLPLGLLRIFVKVSSNPGDIVLDPVAGTFTLSKVAAELRRHSIGIEINPNYVKLGLRRLKND